MHMSDVIYVVFKLHLNDKLIPHSIVDNLLHVCRENLTRFCTGRLFNPLVVTLGDSFALQATSRGTVSLNINS